MSMEHLDRMALMVSPKQPYIDWANSFDDGGPDYDPSARSASVFLNYRASYLRYGFVPTRR